MGLRFRRSITLCKGVKLNFGKTGASISTGVRGFHKTYNFNTGKVTTSIGIPGTGLYYTDTSDGNRISEKVADSQYSPSAYHSSMQEVCSESKESSFSQQSTADSRTVSSNYVSNNKCNTIDSPIIVTDDSIEAIYRVCDDKINWFEILSSSKPSNQWVPDQLWAYLHSVAAKVCQNDHDALLDVIEKINPFDDLLDFCSNFECGFDDDKADCLKIGFEINSNVTATNDLRESLINSCIIRIARDAFALLPINRINIVFCEKNIIKNSFFIASNTIRDIKFRFAKIEDIIDYIKRNSRD